ncbi:ribbon-helix-helix domain-containing protein [Rhizobium panacihumi]|uniref:ribbon-helix-helix domain-containing protein n=1 Tax=Rhizobium panacihumi TaxID=2008450 RepID=UPI003D7A1FE7
MGSESIHVRVAGRLQDHIRQQTGENGLYDNASEYIRSLIRKDIQNSDDAWDWLKQHLEPGLRADEGEFREVSAEDVIRRNKT